jgi:hypothetical protein
LSAREWPDVSLKSSFDLKFIEIFYQLPVLAQKEEHKYVAAKLEPTGRGQKWDFRPDFDLK